MKRSEYEKMQKELFEKARQNLDYFEYPTKDADPCAHSDSHILRVILGDENEERCIDQEFMSEAVTYVLRTPLEDLRFFL